MGMRFLRKHFIELIAAAIVLIILFSVMFPHFQQAQILNQVARARSDLAHIGNAMIAYRLDYEWPLQSVSIKPGASRTQTNPNSVGCDVHIAVEIDDSTSVWTGRRRILAIPLTHLPPKVLLPYIGSYPVPFLPIKSEDGDKAHRKFAVSNTERAMRRLSFFGRNATYMNLHPSLFTKQSDFDYLGIGSGPFVKKQPDISDSDAMLSHRQPYNPTNGLMSHGFLYSLIPQQEESIENP